MKKEMKFTSSQVKCRMWAEPDGKRSRSKNCPQKWVELIRGGSQIGEGSIVLTFPVTIDFCHTWNRFEFAAERVD